MTTLERMYFVFTALILLSLVTMALHRSSLRFSTHPKTEENSLIKVLSKAAMADTTVVVTVVNREWAKPGSVLDLFLESLKLGQGTRKLLHHLVIAASDAQAFRYCIARHPNCYLLHALGVDSFTSSQQTDQSWRKLLFLKQVIDSGHTLLYTDADILWLRTPFQHFKFHDVINIATKADLGVLYMTSDETSTGFLGFWIMTRALNPNASDHTIFQIMEREHLCRMNYLDPNHFSELCQPNKDMRKAVTLHASCYSSTENQVHHMRLALDEWKRVNAFNVSKQM